MVLVQLEKCNLSQEKVREVQNPHLLRASVPKNNAFPSVKISGKADGKFVFSRVVVKEPEIELPVNGSVICPEKGNVICKALTVKNAKKYNFVLTHEAGTKLQYNSTEPIVKVPAEKLLPGVWQVWCAPVGGKAGAKSCFSIKQPQDTTPVFAYNFTPVTDGTVKTYREISLKVLCSADKIDLTKTNFVIINFFCVNVINFLCISNLTTC